MDWIKKLFGGPDTPQEKAPDPVPAQLSAIEAEDIELARQAESIRQRRRELKQRADSLRARRN